MYNREVSRQLQVLKGQWNLIKNECNEGSEIQALWARYMCIRCAGFFEIAFREIFGEYIEKTCAPTTAKYGKQTLKHHHNPNGEYILQTLGFFSVEWRHKLEAEELWRDGGKAAFDSIMTVRHTLAHGGDATITLYTLSEYLTRAVQVIEYVENLCRNEV